MKHFQLIVTIKTSNTEYDTRLIKVSANNRECAIDKTFNWLDRSFPALYRQGYTIAFLDDYPTVKLS